MRAAAAIAILLAATPAAAQDLPQRPTIVEGKPDTERLNAVMIPASDIADGLSAVAQRNDEGPEVMHRPNKDRAEHDP